MSKSMASQAVLDFLEEHNRPFSANEVLNGVGGDHGKSAIQKALDQLVKRDQVTEKAHGKQKVYYIKQNVDVSSTELKESLLEMDRQINETTAQLKEVTGKVKSNTVLVEKVKGRITLEQALDQKLQLEKELEVVKEQLAGYSDAKTARPEEILAAQNRHDKYLSEYRKRKRMCMDVIDSILENYPKSKKHLFEEVGIETDQDVGFSVS